MLRTEVLRSTPPAVVELPLVRCSVGSVVVVELAYDVSSISWLFIDFAGAFRFSSRPNLDVRRFQDFHLDCLGVVE